MIRPKYLWRLTCLVACIGALPLAASTEMNGEAPNPGWQPTKPITIIAPSAPGGGWDMTARFMQMVITRENLSNETVEVVNRGGGSGLIALNGLVSREKGNPHTMMVVGFHMTSSILNLNSRYSLQETTPLARLTGVYQVIAVPADSPFETLDDLLQAFRANPEKISWGGGAAGGADQVFLALLLEKIGIDPGEANYVAFTGGGEVAAAVMGSQVSAVITGYSELHDLLDSGRIRFLAISAPDRRLDPDTPTLIEQGIDLTFSNWRGIVAAPGISREQQASLKQLIDDLHSSPLWHDVLKKNQWQDEYLSEGFDNFLREESARTRHILERMGVGSGDQSNAPIGAAFFPTIIGIGLLISLGMIVFNGWRRRQPAATGVLGPEIPVFSEGHPKLRLFAASTSLLLVYIITSHALGFIYTTPIFIVLMSRINGSRAWVRDTVVAITLTATIAIAFEQLLHVAIP